MNMFKLIAKFNRNFRHRWLKENYLVGRAITPLKSFDDINSFESFQNVVKTVLDSNKHLVDEFNIPFHHGVLFSTDVHMHLYHKMASTAQMLSDLRYVGRGDLSSSTILGPKGIGKSTMLRTFAATIPAIAPNIIPIYISYENKELLKYPITDIIVSALSDVGIMVYTPTITSIAKELSIQNKFVMLFIDETDKLYEQKPNLFNRLFPNRSPFVNTITDLAAIGSNPSGRFATFLCGSSGMLMELVTANAKSNDDAVKLFPSLPFAVNLNESKFREHRIYYGSPIKLDTVSVILGLPSELSSEQKRFVRLVAFIAGCTARSIGRIAGPHRSGIAVGGNDLLDMIVHNKHTARNTWHIKNAGEVYKLVMEKLLFHNRDILNPILDTAEGSKILNVICDTCWESTFSPLNKDDLDEIAATLDLKYDSLYTLLMHLYDRDWLFFGDDIEKIYPYSLWNLVHFANPKNLPEVTNVLADALNQWKTI